VTAPSEAEFQRQVVDLCALYGWRHMHVRRSIGKAQRWTTATNVTGWPDLVIWKPGRRVMFRELKTDRGKLTHEQVDVLDSLRAAGADADVWRPGHLDSGRIQAELAR